MVSDYIDMVYRSAGVEEACEWEGDDSSHACGKAGFGVIYLNRWADRSGYEVSLRSSARVVLCKGHLTGMISLLLDCEEFCTAREENISDLKTRLEDIAEEKARLERELAVVEGLDEDHLVRSS